MEEGVGSHDVRSHLQAEAAHHRRVTEATGISVLAERLRLDAEQRQQLLVRCWVVQSPGRHKGRRVRVWYMNRFCCN